MYIAANVGNSGRWPSVNVQVGEDMRAIKDEQRASCRLTLSYKGLGKKRTKYVFIVFYDYHLSHCFFSNPLSHSQAC